MQNYIVSMFPGKRSRTTGFATVGTANFTPNDQIQLPYLTPPKAVNNVFVKEGTPCQLVAAVETGMIRSAHDRVNENVDTSLSEKPQQRLCQSGFISLGLYMKPPKS